MLLDLGRNDVGRVSTRGSVTVTDSFTVERYSHVMHIVSNVVGALDPNYQALDAIFAGFPAGTVSGAPKIRACEIIAELEPETRRCLCRGSWLFCARRISGQLHCLAHSRRQRWDDACPGRGWYRSRQPHPAYEQRECEAKAGALRAAALEAVRLAREVGFGQ